MKTKFFIYNDRKNWLKYLLPVFMNEITWKMAEEDEKQIWRWLNIGWVI